MFIEFDRIQDINGQSIKKKLPVWNSVVRILRHKGMESFFTGHGIHIQLSTRK